MDNIDDKENQPPLNHLHGFIGADCSEMECSIGGAAASRLREVLLQSMPTSSHVTINSNAYPLITPQFFSSSIGNINHVSDPKLMNNLDAVMPLQMSSSPMRHADNEGFSNHYGIESNTNDHDIFPYDFSSLFSPSQSKLNATGLSGQYQNK